MPCITDTRYENESEAVHHREATDILCGLVRDGVLTLEALPPETQEWFRLHNLRDLLRKSGHWNLGTKHQGWCAEVRERARRLGRR